MSCNVICISHATGSGGEEVGRLVAERLGFLHVDEEIVTWAAIRGGISPDDVASEERRKSFMARVLASIAQAGDYPMAVGVAMPSALDDDANGAAIRGLILEAIEQTAARGDVVITAHAASHALSADATTLRVLVTASPETRALRVAERTGVDAAEAKRTIKASDAGRRDYLKRFYNVAEELPTQYDLVVNTDGIPVDEAAALVARVAEERSAPAARA